MLAAGRRVVVSEFGETPPDAMERFITLEPMPAPDAASVAPGEVLVTIRSASVGWVDLLMTSGQYQHMPSPPYTPGLEYAGVIAAKGAQAAPGFAVGDEVIVDPFLAGPRSIGGHQKSGGWASYAVVPGDAVLRVPGNLSLDAACNLLGNYETAYHCLVARGRLRDGGVGSHPRGFGVDGAGGRRDREAARCEGHRHRAVRGQAARRERARGRSRAANGRGRGRRRVAG